MDKRKIIVINDQIEKALSAVCDAALKYAGMQLIGAVNAVANAVQEEPEEAEEYK